MESSANDRTIERRKRQVAAALISVQEKIADLEKMLDLAHREKEGLVDEATDLGFRKTEIAKLLKITEGRVSQITKSKRKSPS